MPAFPICRRFSFRLLATGIAAILLMAFATIAAPTARAQTNADQGAVRSVISDQLDAFLADDAARAYSHASPGIRQLFPGEERFMGMVQRDYAPVYRKRPNLPIELPGFVPGWFLRFLPF